MLFFSRDFLLPDLTFKFLINFEIVFVHGIGKWSSLILLRVGV